MSHKHEMYMVLAVVLLLLFVPSCKKEKKVYSPISGTSAPANVAGFWHLDLQFGGVNIGETFVCLDQSNGLVSGILATAAPFAGAMSGDTLTWRCDFGAPGSYMCGTATVSGPNELSGPLELYDAGVLTDSGTTRFVRYYPSGQFTAAGTVEEHDVDVDTLTNGWGRIDGEAGVVGDVEVCYTTPDLALSIWLYPAENLAAGTFTVVAWPPGAIAPDEIEPEVSRITWGNSIYAEPESGSVVIEKFDATGIKGTFTFNFNGGTETLSGSFDVSWDIIFGDPFP